MPIRHLSLADFLGLASKVYATPVEELATDGVLGRAKLALDAVAAESRGPIRRHRDIHHGMRAKAAALVASLLRKPPLATRRGLLAYACLQEFLRWNNARWRAEAPLTVLRF